MIIYIYIFLLGRGDHLRHRRPERAVRPRERRLLGHAEGRVPLRGLRHRRPLPIPDALPDQPEVRTLQFLTAILRQEKGMVKLFF